MRTSKSLLFVTLALMASTAFAAPKKGGKKAAPPPTPPAAGSADPGEVQMDGDSSSKPKAGGTAATPAPAAGGEIEMDDDKSAGSNDLAADLAASDAQQTEVTKQAAVTKTPLSWQDIVVVIRKPFLKTHRTELNPFVGTTMNDNIIRHYSEGGELAYYLTDVLAIGIEGQYYEHVFQEPFDLVARQARRLPTVNQYNWSGALDFHYVPVYGKFAVLDHRLVTWEAYFTAGIGAGQSEVIPRDTKFPGFNNFLIQPNVGVGMRFFLAKWLTFNFGIRDYVFYDHFEPTDRSATVDATAAEASAHSDGSLINNIMFQVGLSFWLPTSFEYTTFR
jgi:outer membrane beta-barrel protein